MARKSRRNNNKSEPTIMKTPVSAERRINTALYARLSSEQDDNDTILNQIDYLKDFISGKSDFEVYDIYSDHGFSGTNFDRPDFNRMMADVRAGKVQCIVIKDLSRFGRNFIETGYYIETLLPKLNVRLISINDNYDSSREQDRESISVPIRNMVNDFYAKDISRKICASNEIRRKSGNYTIEQSLYGYSVDKEGNAFTVNPDTAPVVQLIFRWYLSGVMGSEIARRLNYLGIMTPAEYKCIHETGAEYKQSKFWDSGKVLKVLSSDSYAGDRCLGVRPIALYKNQTKRERMPKEEWTIYEDDHPALVTRADLARAHAMLEECRLSRREAAIARQKMRKEREGMFTSMVYCRHCGRLMHHEVLKYPGGKIKPEGNSYVCKGHMGMDSTEGCGARINTSYLQIVVGDQIRLFIQTVIEKDELIRKLMSQENNKNAIYRIRSKINSLVYKESQQSERIIKLYEDYSDGVLDKEDYLKLKSDYQKKQADLIKQIEGAEAELQKTEDNVRRLQRLSKELRSYIDNLDVTKELAQQFIEKIIVDGNSVEIIFKFRDVYEDVIDNWIEGDDV